MSVSQLQANKSLELRAHDLISFATDLETARTDLFLK